MRDKKKTLSTSRRSFFKLLTAGSGLCLFNSPALASNKSSSATKKSPRLTESENFTVVMIPDTQSYVKFERNQGIWELMAGWIAENINSLNILTAVQVGDLVEANDMSNPDGKRYNQDSLQMWNSVSNGFKRLDGKIPYIPCTGNHDYGILSAEDRRTKFPDFFPIERNSSLKGVLVECCVNRDGKKTLENAAYRMKTPSGRHLLFVALEFAPCDTAVAWAKKLFARPDYADDIGVVVTHSYMRHMMDKNVLIVDEPGYKIRDVNYGEAIWEKLIQPATNIRLVLCGHIAVPNNFKGGVGFRRDKNVAGKVVTQMLFNTQALGGGWMGNGGDGWLRLLEFTPDCRHVTVKTFSPLFAISPATRHGAWESSDYNEFTFDLD